MTATTDGSAGAVGPRAAAASTTHDTGATAPDLDGTAARAAERAAEHLLALQDPEGWWKGDLETNVTMDAEDLLLRQFRRSSVFGVWRRVAARSCRHGPVGYRSATHQNHS